MLFEQVVKKAISQRPNMEEAIGYYAKVSEHLVTTDTFLPPVLSNMYRIVTGTLASIEDQSVMDIIPGLRLIHHAELQNETKKFTDMYTDLMFHVPFLADYSSCYVTVNTYDGAIYRVAPEYGTSKVALSLDAFWETVLTCYQNGAFFLDDEGYLDFDFEAEGRIGLRMNPNCEYWME